jgi:hypothetical protein
MASIINDACHVFFYPLLPFHLRFFKEPFLTGLTGYSGLKHQNASCKSSSKSFTLRLISTCPPPARSCLAWQAGRELRRGGRAFRSPKLKP